MVLEQIDLNYFYFKLNVQTFFTYVVRWWSTSLIKPYKPTRIGRNLKFIAEKAGSALRVRFLTLPKAVLAEVKHRSLTRRRLLWYQKSYHSRNRLVPSQLFESDMRRGFWIISEIVKQSWSSKCRKSSTSSWIRFDSWWDYLKFASQWKCMLSILLKAVSMANRSRKSNSHNRMSQLFDVFGQCIFIYTGDLTLFLK